MEGNFLIKIVHISDVHIRNLKYHEEYRRVFEDLYAQVKRLSPDIIVNTGDLAHTKTQISPEFVEMTSEHLRRASELAPYHLILGNHDLNLMNLDRRDAISPIVDSIGSDRIFLHKKSGLSYTIEKDGQKYNLWSFSLADQQNYPSSGSWARLPDDVNIGMFHGSISSCVTDTNWRMTHVEHDMAIFDGLDYVLLGDIHKQQFFRNRTIAYAGSLIQQNFGEELDKGLLYWEIGPKGKGHTVSPVNLRGSRGFYTLKIADDLSVPDAAIARDSRVRISPPRSLTLVETKSIEKEVRKKYDPYDVMTLSPTNIGEQKIKISKKSSEIENLRQIAVQEKLIKEFFDEELSETLLEKILDMNRRFQVTIDQDEKISRNVTWKINKLGWSNLFNYGEQNVIDFSRLGGVTGIFGANGAGKSNMIDVIMETCFDAQTKGITKNIFLINDNKDIASSVAEIEANGQTYEITRKIDKVKYGQKSEKTKEWGKTTVNFAKVDEHGDKEQLVGTSRPETEANIRQKIGTFDDFMLTSLFAQWNPMDIISAKETKRKEIIFRFLDLDIFGQKAQLARDESREFNKKLEELQSDGLERALEFHRDEVKELRGVVDDLSKKIKEGEWLVDQINKEIVQLTSEKVHVENIKSENWPDLIREKESSLSSIEESLNKNRDEYTALEKKIRQFEEGAKQYDIDAARRAEREYTQAKKSQDSLSEKIKSRQSMLSSLISSSAKMGPLLCAKCGESMDPVSCRPEIANLTNEIAELKREYAENGPVLHELKSSVDLFNVYKVFDSQNSSDRSRLETIKMTIENLELRKVAINSSISSLRRDMLAFEENKAGIIGNANIDKTIKSLVSRLENCQSSINSDRKDLNDSNVKLGASDGVLQKLEKQIEEINDLKDLCSSYEHYIKAMGKDGIPYQILAQKLPLLNEEINKILSGVADFGVTLEHDAEEQSIRFYIQYGQYKSRLLELGGGAEKFLASIAIRNALLNISILPKTNMLIIDEGFGKLDPKNIESVNRMFDYLRTVFDHVFIISHIESMKDMVDNIIEIVNDQEGYAHVEIGENPDVDEEH